MPLDLYNATRSTCKSPMSATQRESSVCGESPFRGNQSGVSLTICADCALRLCAFDLKPDEINAFIEYSSAVDLYNATHRKTGDRTSKDKDKIAQCNAVFRKHQTHRSDYESTRARIFKSQNKHDGDDNKVDGITC